MVNSGCFLRQLQPVSPRLKGPPVFVSKFVLTHVSVFAEDGQLASSCGSNPRPRGSPDPDRTSPFDGAPAAAAAPRGEAAPVASATL